jgi:chromosome partitioning protein
VINDFLSSNAEVEDVMYDLTYIIEEILLRANSKNASSSSQSPYLSYPSSSSSFSSKDEPKKEGKLWVGFSSPKKEEIFKLDTGTNVTKREILRRFILLREKLTTTYDPNYIVIDTSPGIRYWSLNSLAISDIILLTLKTGEIDIEGTKRIAQEIYSSLTKTGSKALLVSNRVAGYCVPNIARTRDFKHDRNAESVPSVGPEELNKNVGIVQQLQADPTSEALSKEVGIKIISSIPCYSDIQFSKREFLTVISDPQHPFAKQIEQLTVLLLL